MLGLIAGDIVGSPYEGRPIKSKKFPLFSSNSTFTDDTVLAIAVADALLNGGSYAQTLRSYGRTYPKAGYGQRFIRWLKSDDAGPYNSFGNGSAMRVGPVGWFCNSLEEVMEEAKKSAEVTHNHPEGIKGAQAVAVAVFLAREGKSRKKIRTNIEQLFDYNLSSSLKSIRRNYRFDVTCRGSVPEAIIAFLESSSFEDALRNAVSLGGDSDTQAAIAGVIAEAYYGKLPANIKKELFNRLDADLEKVVREFQQKHVKKSNVYFLTNLLKLDV
ncbi:MAG: ADP-ribosylglycohydrolase family protein [Magnetococcales bacterium]|nr:ADP-ribosylglycohydrolase family protein [Magnetococcales bacterium]